MNKEYYFLFSKDNMPLAIFLTETAEESRELFCRLFRRSWEDIEKTGSYMKREKDVPAEMWDEIHEKYKASDRKKEIKQPAAVQIIKLPKKQQTLNNQSQPLQQEHGTMFLETEKYLRPQ